MTRPRPTTPSAPATAALPRRQLLLAGSGAVLLALHTRPARAVSATAPLREVERLWANGRPITEGRVQLEVAPLVENGNAVPITVRMDSPMTEADHVTELVVFNERNPQRDVVRFSFTPASGRAQASTRIRLATSQQLAALARLSDGSQWSVHVDVIVTLAACIES